MKNWLKILKFTLKQAVKGSKFVPTTLFVGIFILVATAVSNILISGAFDDGPKVKDLKKVYLVNETALSIDTEDFLDKNRDEYPFLQFKELKDTNAKDAATSPEVLDDGAELSIILDIAEDEESSNLTVYIPNTSKISDGDAQDFAEEFSETVKNSKIKSTGVSKDKVNMAISDIKVTQVKAEEADETKDLSLLASMTQLVVIMLLYFLVLFYGQSIGQIVSMEKTSKLMEYMLTLTSPMGIIFGKVTAVFCEAVTQIIIWIACGVGGFVLSSTFIRSIPGKNNETLISSFIEMLPEDAVTHNFAVLVALTIIAILAAFLFYCFVSALFASFAATAEDLTQTNAYSIMTMMFGFMLSLYVPMFTDNNKTALAIIRIIPFTSSFILPGDVIASRISIAQYVIHLAILLIFTVLLAMLTGKVYKNRLFKRGTKNIFAEIISAITGKAPVSENDDNAAATAEIKATATNFEYLDSAKKAYTIAGFSLLALILGANAIGGLVGNVIANMMAARKNMALTDVYQDGTFLTLNNIVAMYCVAVPLFALFIKLTDSSKLDVKGTISRNQYIRLLLIVFPITTVLGQFSNFLASALSGGQAENSIDVFLTGNPLAMVMVAILAPIFEELVFRKLLIDRTIRYGEFVAILFSSLAFGIFHCNLYQIFYAFAIGLILGYIYVRTGNMILTIIIHMAINGTSSVLYPLAPEAYKYFLYVVLVLGAISIIYTLIKRDIKLEPTENEVSTKELSRIALTNPGSILFALACFIIMIYQLFAPMLLG